MKDSPIKRPCSNCLSMNFIVLTHRPTKIKITVCKICSKPLNRVQLNRMLRIESLGYSVYENPEDINKTISLFNEMHARRRGPTKDDAGIVWPSF